MPRLTALKPVLKPLSQRVEKLDAYQNEAERSRQRASKHSWRSWYNTSRWQKLRKEIWVRDAYVCQKTGVICIGKYPAPNSPVADHIVAHRGDPALFWDQNNLQTVSKAYHDAEKQRLEQSSLHTRGNWD